MPFTIQNNCHVRIWTNLAAPPSGGPTYDGPCERLLPSDNKLNIWRQRFVLPTTALGISPQSILPTGTNITYLAIVDDVTTDIAGYWQVVDVSLQTVAVSPGVYTVVNVFIEAVLEECPCGTSGGSSDFDLASYVLAQPVDTITDSTVIPCIDSGIAQQTTAGAIAALASSGGGFGGVVYSQSWVNQTADLPAFTMFTPPADGLFVFNGVMMNPTTDAGASPVTGSIIWTDDVASFTSGVISVQLANPWSGSGGLNDSDIFRAKGGIPVQFEAVGGGTYGAATWDMFIAIQQLM